MILKKAGKSLVRLSGLVGGSQGLLFSPPYFQVFIITTYIKEMLLTSITIRNFLKQGFTLLSQTVYKLLLGRVRSYFF